LFIEDWDKLDGDKLLSAYDHLIPGLPLKDHQATTTETFATMQIGHALSCSTKMLSFLWSDAANEHYRTLFHCSVRLIHSYGEHPAVCFVIIESVEETGLVMFASIGALVREIENSGGLNLRYFGDNHLALETGHLMNQKHAIPHDQINGIHCECKTDEIFKKSLLNELQHIQCILAVDSAVSYFTEWFDDIFNMLVNCN
jgi:hypothetical protein